jgi:16S rRNA (cytosine1402-N4)-methyltransferase
MTTSQQLHRSVLLEEATTALGVEPGKWYLDATFGRGGHSQSILAAGGNVIGMDWDQEAIVYGQTQYAEQINAGRLVLLHANFAELQTRLTEVKLSAKISGVLFDFGVSSPQLDTPERGFSFQFPAELDMRMDQRLGVKAKDLLALLSVKQLTEIFRDYGGEHEARQVAQAIVFARQHQSLTTTTQLAELIAKTKRERRGHLHPATKVFQALRMIVNSELDNIQAALPQALRTVESGGHIVTISFHEGEDRIVKTVFRQWESQQLGEIEQKKVITAGEDEVEENTRSRSAKLRIFRKA